MENADTLQSQTSAVVQRHLSAQCERLSCLLHSISTPLAAVMAATGGFPGEGFNDIKDVVRQPVCLYTLTLPNYTVFDPIARPTRPIHNTPNPK